MYGRGEPAVRLSLAEVWSDAHVEQEQPELDDRSLRNCPASSAGWPMRGPSECDFASGWGWSHWCSPPYASWRSSCGLTGCGSCRRGRGRSRCRRCWGFRCFCSIAIAGRIGATRPPRMPRLSFRRWANGCELFFSMPRRHAAAVPASPGLLKALGRDTDRQAAAIDFRKLIPWPVFERRAIALFLTTIVGADRTGCEPIAANSLPQNAVSAGSLHHHQRRAG